MSTFLIAVGSFVLYLIAYHTYGRWLARKFFKLDRNAPVPSKQLNDGQDYVPTRREILFGHHFTSIAGTGPIVGPALAVIWGWLPALLWVLFGSIFIGAVHDFGALVVSIRNRGQTVGEVAGRLINPRVKILFLLILFLALTIVLAIFGLVIASIFAMYPASVLSVWLEIPLAVAMGYWIYRKRKSPHLPAVMALALMLLAVVLAVKFPILQFMFEPLTVAGLTVSPVVIWTVLLFVYCYVASTMPVWKLLQPRDYINSHQLILCLFLIVAGIGAATFFTEGGAPIVAPAIRAEVPGAPPIMPFLFVTIACGAISGFHCLVSSGTTSKQISCETDAQFVGYGSMLTEGFLAVLVILACCAGLGIGTNIKSITWSWTTQQEYINNPKKTSIQGRLWDTGFSTADSDYWLIHRRVVEEDVQTSSSWALIEEQGRVSESGWSNAVFSPGSLGEREIGLTPGDKIALRNGTLSIESDGTAKVSGPFSWHARYGSWHDAGGLAAKVGAFVEGAGNLVASLGIPVKIAIALMAVLVASFAATTLDTATRLQRYVVQELANSFHVRPLTTKHGATLFAVVIAAVVAALPPPNMTWANGMGKGGLILWPVFGATNQLLAGLAFMVVAFYLARRKKPTWFIVFPAILMLVVPFCAMLYQLGVLNPDGWWPRRQWHLVVTGVIIVALQAWMVAEALKLWPKVRGILEVTPPPLPRGFPVVETAGSPAPTDDQGRSC
ncbi:MAG: carbon starvation protein A [Phycisphaerales bacterium]|nr:carbon starvation protein A [Phycisphaerales bacterium]